MPMQLNLCVVSELEHCLQVNALKAVPLALISVGELHCYKYFNHLHVSVTSIHCYWFPCFHCACRFCSLSYLMEKSFTGFCEIISSAWACLPCENSPLLQRYLLEPTPGVNSSQSAFLSALYFKKKFNWIKKPKHDQKALNQNLYMFYTNLCNLRYKCASINVACTIFDFQ